MLTPRLDRIFSLFERVESLNKLARDFERHPGPTPTYLPLDYRLFVSADRRTLPSSWELYSFYGHAHVQLDEINAEMRADDLPDGYVIFGKTGDEDFLVFRDRAVHWCDADSLSSLPTSEPFAPTFSQALLKMTQLRLGKLRREVEDYEAELRAIHHVAQST